MAILVSAEILDRVFAYRVSCWNASHMGKDSFNKHSGALALCLEITWGHVFEGHKRSWRLQEFYKRMTLFSSFTNGTLKHPISLCYPGHFSFACAETIFPHVGRCFYKMHWVDWKQTGFSSDSESWIWGNWWTLLLRSFIVVNVVSVKLFALLL